MCLIEKPETEFYKKSTKHGLRPNCKSCHNKVAYAWQRNNPERVQLHNNRRIAARYGITLEELNQLRDKFPSCPVCGEKERLVVDHDHSTGEVRGILCNSCNMGLGKLGDSVSNVRNLLKYLTDNL